MITPAVCLTLFRRNFLPVAVGVFSPRAMRTALLKIVGIHPQRPSWTCRGSGANPLPNWFPVPSGNNMLQALTKYFGRNRHVSVSGIVAKVL